jgi:hypothetical protein
MAKKKQAVVFLLRELREPSTTFTGLISISVATGGLTSAAISIRKPMPEEWGYE